MIALHDDFLLVAQEGGHYIPCPFQIHYGIGSFHLIILRIYLQYEGLVLCLVYW